MEQRRGDPVQADLPFSLISGGDCTLHFHTEDRAPTHDTLDRLEQLANQISVSAPYAVRYADDVLLVTNGATVTLPLARNGKEFEVVQTDTNAVLVNLTSPDIIYGNTSVTLTTQGMALRFKSIVGGWVLI